MICKKYFSRPQKNSSTTTTNEVDLMKPYVNDLPADGFKYLYRKFPHLSKTKKKDCHWVESEIQSTNEYKEKGRLKYHVKTFLDNMT